MLEERRKLRDIRKEEIAELVDRAIEQGVIQKRPRKTRKSNIYKEFNFITN